MHRFQNIGKSSANRIAENCDGFETKEQIQRRKQLEGMSKTGDNPPVGLLLWTKKGKKMVEYAKAGMDNKLFVSTYQLQLPDESTLERFLLRQLEENQ